MDKNNQDYKLPVYVHGSRLGLHTPKTTTSGEQESKSVALHLNIHRVILCTKREDSVRLQRERSAGWHQDVCRETLTFANSGK